jgi:hypothetical protein
MYQILDGTYTHIPYDSKAMKSGFKQFYDYVSRCFLFKPVESLHYFFR